MPIITYTCTNKKCINEFDEFIHNYKNVTEKFKCSKCGKIAKKNPFGKSTGMNGQMLTFFRCS